TGFVSRIGNDEFGRYLFNFIRGEGIDTSEVKLIDGYPTSINFKEIFADGTGRTFYYRDRSPMEVLTQDDIREDFIQTPKAVHITGDSAALHPKNIDMLESAVTLAKTHGVKVSIDANVRVRLWDLDEAREGLFRLLPYADMV